MVNALLVLIAPGRHHTQKLTNLSAREANLRKERLEEEETAVLPTLVAQTREVDIPLEALIALLEATPRKEAVPSPVVGVVMGKIVVKTLVVVPLAKRNAEPNPPAKGMQRETSNNPV